MIFKEFIEALVRGEILEAATGERIKLTSKGLALDVYKQWSLVDKPAVKKYLENYDTFRIVPKTIAVTVEIPEPEKEPLNVGDIYYIPDIYSVIEKSDCWTWSNSTTDNHFLRSGIIHKTRENASKHANSLIALTSSTIQEKT